MVMKKSSSQIERLAADITIIRTRNNFALEKRKPKGKKLTTNTETENQNDRVKNYRYRKEGKQLKPKRDL